ncbi:MAG: hypothetical protein EA351_12720 [Gemmatimonadales bacterium]|nr:MAG: hypothetical protein EA351_12720 [Gemmatimonadales bacterium]
MGTVARSAVTAAIATSKELGLSASDAASAAVTGALHAARDVGESAVTSVSSLLDTTIDGVKVVAKAPFKGEGKEKKEQPPQVGSGD